MALELRQVPKLVQQTIMTPQLQQSIKLLQLSRLELTDLVQNEMVENPTLEEAQDSGDGDDASSLGPDSEAEVGREPDKTDEVMQGPEDGNLGIKWEEYLNGGAAPGNMGSRNEDDEDFSLENRLVKKTSLYDHLMWQLRFVDFAETEKWIGSLIIGNIDGDGYFRAELADIAETAAVDESVAEGVLRRIQEFDPIGVAAIDLADCLLIQVKHLIGGDPIVEGILLHHLHDLENRRYQAIAKKMGASYEKIIEAVKLISELEPKPGRYFNEEDTQYITPDIYVFKEEDEFRIVLNEDGLPKLRISHFYRNALSQKGLGSAAAKEYIQEKIRSAVWLIKSIHQRQRTIYKVIVSIVSFQEDFFERGSQYLKPLALREIAEDIEMHESTVSRVTTNKYVHTPQGIFELKYFFNSGIECSVGGSIASQSVKEKIKQIIITENSKKPYSDQKIMEILLGSNINIARRTVTKYREMLKILPSSKRKKVF